MRALFIIVAGLVVTTEGTAADWPHPRGPNYDSASCETGLAETWPSEGPPVLWARELGPGYAGFVVAEGRAFTLFQTTTGMFLTALDADAGDERWRTRVDAPWQAGGMYPGPYATPMWHAGRVFYATPTGRMGCLDAADGRTVWTVDLRAKFGGSGTEFGFAATPLVDPGRLREGIDTKPVEDGRVILPVGGDGASVVALAAGDGSTLWRSGTDAASYCPLRPITVDGRRLLVGYLRNALVLHDPSTGERVWRERLSGSYDEHAAWPLWDGRHLLVASPFRAGTRVFRLNATATGVSGEAVWSGRQLSNDVCSSLLVDGHVYGFDIHQAQASTHRAARGEFKCLDLVTGKVRRTCFVTGSCRNPSVSWNPSHPEARHARLAHRPRTHRPPLGTRPPAPPAPGPAPQRLPPLHRRPGVRRGHRPRPPERVPVAGPRRSPRGPVRRHLLATPPRLDPGRRRDPGLADRPRRTRRRRSPRHVRVRPRHRVRGGENGGPRSGRARAGRARRSRS